MDDPDHIGEPVWVEPGSPRPGAGLVESAFQAHHLVIVGAARTGKSRLLREIVARVPSEWEIMLPPITPRTDTWRRLCRPAIDVSHWENVWRILIVGSYLSFARTHQDLLDAESLQRLTLIMQALSLGEPSSGRHPYTVMTELSNSLQSASGSDLTKGKESDWQQAEKLITDVAPELPSLAIVIDHLDDYFDNHPSEMAEVQSGLVALIAHNDRQPWIPRNVRLLTAVRRSTLEFLKQNGGMNVNAAAWIKEVVWDLASLERLFIRRLCGPDNKARTVKWLVRTADQAGSAGDPKRLVDHLVQHTSLAAGDIETMAELLRQKRDFVGRHLTVDEFFEEISSAAVDVSIALAHNTISDLRSLAVPRGTARHQALEASDEQSDLRRQLITSISAMESDTFTPSEAARMLEAFPENLRFLILEALWRSRLVARVEGRTWFYSRTYTDRLGPAWTRAGWNPVLADECKFTSVSKEISVGYA